MANLLSIIEKEVEKGNVFIDTTGNFITAEKLEERLKKDYLKALKDGIICFNMSFKTYSNRIKETMYSKTEDVLTELSNFLSSEETEERNEPSEETALELDEK